MTSLVRPIEGYGSTVLLGVFVGLALAVLASSIIGLPPRLWRRSRCLAAWVNHRYGMNSRLYSSQTTAGRAVYRSTNLQTVLVAQQNSLKFCWLRVGVEARRRATLGRTPMWTGSPKWAGPGLGCRCMLCRVCFGDWDLDGTP